MLNQCNRIGLLAIGLLLSDMASANHVTDPGFESKSTAHLWGGSAVVSTDKRSGYYAAQLADPGGYHRTFTGLSPNSTYIFSAYVKTVGGSALIGVKNYGSSEVKKTFNSSSYVLVEIEFTTGDWATTAECFIFNSPGDATEVYADDLSLALSDVSLPPLEPLSGDYELIFSDEFNTEGAIDLDKWTPEIGFKRNNEDQYYRAENLNQTGGNLVITAKREQFLNAEYDPSSQNWRKNIEYANWTSGSILTVDSFKFLYGKIECRAKITNLPGTWPAIWTTGGGEWPATGEIDIMENYGGKILANFATAANGRWTPAWDGSSRSVSSYPAGWVDDFHTWEVVWSPDLLSISMDGQILNTFNPSKVNGSGSHAYPGVAAFKTFSQLLRLNLAIGGNAGGDPSNLPDETSYLIDYIRVYQKEHPKFQSNFSFLNDDDLRLDFNTIEGRRYSVMESTNLSNWIELTNLRGTRKTMSYAARDAINAPQKFYRIEVDNTQWIDEDSP